MTPPPRGRRRSSSEAPFPGLGPVGEAVPISTGSAELVVESDGSVLLLVNGVPSSHLDPDPDHLVFEYMRWMRTAMHCWILERRAGDGADGAGSSRRGLELAVAHLGGAGCALPRTLAHDWPRARQIVVELDALLAEHVRTWFSLPRSPQLRIRVDDAAHALEEWREDRFDVLTRDVFAGDRTPSSLTSVEAARHARRVLADDGLYLANCASRPGSRLLADELTTLSSVFAHVGAIAEPAHLKGRRRGNCVLLASDAPLPASLDRALRSDPVAVRLAAGEDAARIAAPGAVLEGGAQT
ncbi:spermidine synthase [Brachybacterium subflavum]|uniref:spermidine synthase n=1 Tax=Brachybacterium subflavum TaxID=2585206 RepID=UPI00187AD928|nr:fused MFS/spermidine synthase [Brachybacterium subflavum]